MVNVSSPSVVTREPAEILLHNSGARHPAKERKGRGGGGRDAGTFHQALDHWLSDTVHTHTLTLEGVGTGGGYEKVIQCMKFNIFQDEHESSGDVKAWNPAHGPG